MENVIYEIQFANGSFERTTDQKKTHELAKNAISIGMEWQDEKGEWRSMELVPSRM